MRNTHFIEEKRNAQDALRNTHSNLKIAGMKVGEKIRKLRTARGLKLSEVEARAGLSDGNLSRVERSQQWLSEEKLFALADVLGVSPAQFFAPAEPTPGQVDPDVIVGMVNVLRQLSVEDQRLALAQIESLGAVATRGRRTAANEE